MKKILALLFALAIVVLAATPARATNPAWQYRASDPRTSTWNCTLSSVGHMHIYSCTIAINDYVQFAVLAYWDLLYPPEPDSLGNNEIETGGNDGYIDGSPYFIGYGCSSDYDINNPWMVCFTSTVHKAGSHTGQNHFNYILHNNGSLGGPSPFVSPLVNF